MDQKPREAVFLRKARFRLPVPRSALLYKTQVDPPEVLGLYNNRRVTNMAVIDDA